MTSPGTHRADSPADPAPVRAKDVQVDKLYRARCHRRSCDWTGEEHAAWQETNDERIAHLNEHTPGGLW